MSRACCQLWTRGVTMISAWLRPRLELGWVKGKGTHFLRIATAATLMLPIVGQQTQAAVAFSDNFNRPDNTVVGNNWTEVNTGLGNAQLLANNLVISSSAVAGRSYVSQDTTAWIGGYTQRLNQTVGLISWRWNMRVNRANLSGFGSANYGIGFVLAASSSDFLTGSGYAVVWGQNQTDPLRLVVFTNGLQTSSSSTLSNIVTATEGGFTNMGTAYYSLRVTYDPDGDFWEMYARDDGVGGFADPATGTLTFVGSVANSTFTGTPLNYMGALWNYGTVVSQSAYFDNLTVEVLQLPPSIFVQPASQLVVRGSNATLSVTAKGTRPLSYQWRFQDANLPGQTNATLTLVNFQPANEGDYRVVVTNNYGGLTSTVATLIVNRDYGDAPHLSYPTHLSQNGARHIFVPGFYLGSAVDGETNGQSSASATGDDLTSLNDDDGVVLTSALVSGQTATVQTTAATSGYLNAWLDFNQNGSWADAGEQIFANQPLSPGVNNLNFGVPGSAVSGTNAYARFRLSSATGLSFTGEAPDGEVEDYQFAINTTADLAVSISDSPDPVAVGSNLTWTVVVSNRGPSQASAVRLTNTLPVGVSFTSATSTQGSCSQAGNVVTCNLGMLLAGFQATVTIFAVPTSAGMIASSVEVTRNEVDDSLPNNSASAGTTVYNRPAITTQPQSLTVTNGNDAAFSVTASGTGTLLYQWRLNGISLSGRTNQTLVITNSQLANAGAYDVLVRDDVGHAFSDPATLTVLAPPGITNQPQSQIGNLGGYVTLGVGVSGTSPFGYQWYFNTSNAVSGGTAATLTLTNLQTSNAGNYHVIVTNTAGAVTSAVAVLTIAPMDFGDAPTNYPTLLAANGARHVIVSGIRLGSGVSQDTDGKPNATATGDDLEDGVTFTNALVAGQTRWVRVVVSTNGYLDGWLDLNQNGSWSDATEQVLASRAVTNGTNMLSFTVPFTALSGTTFARFRFSSAGGLAPTGLALDGEVEDQAVSINAAVPVQLVLYTDAPAEAIAGAPFEPPPVVLVADNLGQPVISDSSTVVTAFRLSGAGALQGTLSVTADHGYVAFTNLFHTLATNITLKFTNATLGSLTSSVVTVYSAAASKLAVKTQPSSTATAGTAFGTQPAIRVEDAFGNLCSDDSGRGITAARNLGSGALQGNTTATTTNGVAVFSGLAHTVANTINLAFDTAGLAGVISSNIVVSPAAATRLAFTTQPGNVTAGAVFGVQPVVKTQDNYGNNSTVSLAPNKTVTLALTSGDGPLQGTTSFNIGGNGGNGTITFTDLRIDAGGTNKQLTVTTSGYTNGLSSFFTVNAGAANRLTISTPPSTSATAGTPFGQQPVIRVEDVHGNLRTLDNSTLVTAVRAAGAGTLGGNTNLTAVGGLVVYTNLSHPVATNITIQFTASGIASATSGTISNLPGPANRLAIVTQPSPTATAGAAFAQQPAVRVEDAFGNFRAADSGLIVTATRLAGSGTLQGTTGITMTNGVAVFTNLSHPVATNITVQFSSASLSNATSSAIAIQPAAATQLVFEREPGGAVVGSVFGVQPFVVSRDAFGNDSAVGLPASLNLNIGLSQGSGPLLGTTNLNIGTASGNGRAAFTNLRLDVAGTNRQLLASASGLISANSGIFAVAKADQTITFGNLTNKVYGAVPFGLSAGASSGLPVLFSAISGGVSVAGNVATITAAGGATIRASQNGNENYNPAAPVDQGFTVATASLSVSAHHASRGYGETNPVFTGSIVGIQYGDDISATFSTIATPASPAGAYSITPGLVDPDAKLPNYAVTITNGVLTVTNPASAPRITELTVSGNIVLLSFTTENGLYHQVEFKSALADPAWSSLTNLVGNGGVMSVTDNISAVPRRFYRVSRP